MASKPHPETRPTPTREAVSPACETVLLAVTGMSPAVLTETVWALCQGTEPVLPSRVIVLTTVTGKECLERDLLSPNPSLGGRTPWQALRDAVLPLFPGVLPASALQLEPARVLTAPDAETGQARELTDVRTADDNAAAADFLLEQLRGIVENPDQHLVASVAGGRKTMGALLYACMTLAGRETDRLTHVLVSEPFETLRGFYFPGQPGGDLCAPDGTTLAPSAARLELADVPFVPLRNLFTRQLGRKAGTFSRLIESCREQVRQSAGQELRLTVELSRTEIEVNGTRVKLAPREHMLLLFLATRAKQSDPPLAAQKDAVDPLNEFRRSTISRAPREELADWRHTDSLAGGFEEQDIRRGLSSLRQKLAEAGAQSGLLASCLPQKGCFSLAIPGSLIFLR